jgi:hypothetical protein
VPDGRLGELDRSRPIPQLITPIRANVRPLADRRVVLLIRPLIHPPHLKARPLLRREIVALLVKQPRCLGERARHPLAIPSLASSASFSATAASDPCSAARCAT